MKNLRASGILIRSFIVIAALIGIASGVTFAGLQSGQSKITGNTIQTASANLLVSTDGSNYSSSQTGFAFNNLVPGGSAVPTSGYPLYLRNAGTTPLSLKLAVSSVPSNPDNADLTKVMIILRPATGGAAQTYSLQTLIDASANGGVSLTVPSPMMSGTSYQYLLQVLMQSDAVNGPSATISSLDLSFSGVATN